jgi:LysM repeat protein
MYLTEDKRICIMQNTIPIMGFVDMQNISDDNICDAKFEIKNILLKPNSVEEHSIYVEAEIEIMCNVYETKNIDIIQDLYSPTANLIYKPKMIRGITQSSCTKDVYSVREKQNIPEIGNNKIYDVEVLPYINNQTINKDRIIYEGEVQIKFLFASQNNTGINVKSITIPFNYNMSCTGVNEESNINTQIQVLMQDFIVMSDESIDVKIDLEFAVNISNSQNINVIQEIDVSENGANEKSSIIIYFVKRDDTLWKIAKRFKSTVSAIAKINDIEDENKINVGEQLFIPMSI